MRSAERQVALPREECRSRRRSRLHSRGPFRSRFLNVLAGVVKQADDVMVIEIVKREAADPSNPHEPRSTEKAQLMRYGRLG